MRLRTQPWTEVTSYYADLATNHPSQPMLDLVQFLSSSRYAASLFPCTSQEQLRIGRTADFEAGRNELQIQFDEASQSFKFTYLQRPDDPSPWSRSCGASEWRQVLERTLHKRLSWFHEG
jgi:hypothetical protein